MMFYSLDVSRGCVIHVMVVATTEEWMEGLREDGIVGVDLWAPTSAHGGAGDFISVKVIKFTPQTRY